LPCASQQSRLVYEGLPLGKRTDQGALILCIANRRGQDGNWHKWLRERSA
jgi:hypothetical protein